MMPTKKPSSTYSPTSDPTLCNGGHLEATCCDEIFAEKLEVKDCAKRSSLEQYLTALDCNLYCSSFVSEYSTNDIIASNCFVKWAEYTKLNMLCNDNKTTTWDYYENNKNECFPCYEYKPDAPECTTTKPTIS